MVALSFVFCFESASQSFSQPNNYYTTTFGLTGDDLKAELHEILSDYNDNGKISRLEFEIALRRVKIMLNEEQKNMKNQLVALNSKQQHIHNRVEEIQEMLNEMYGIDEDDTF